MALTESEIQSLRFHLGYGNISVGAYPATPDGFYEVFNAVISPNLQTGTETTATTAITAASTTTVTPVAMTDIVVNSRLVVDVGDLAEVVVVKSVAVSTFTATFANAHPASGYPVALLSGVARLRLLLHAADKAHTFSISSKITRSSGLKKVDEVEWFEPGGARIETFAHYRDIVMSISDLVRVQPRWAGESRGRGRLEPH